MVIRVLIVFSIAFANFSDDELANFLDKEDDVVHLPHIDDEE